MAGAQRETRRRTAEQRATLARLRLALVTSCALCFLAAPKNLALGAESEPPAGAEASPAESLPKRTRRSPAVSRAPKSKLGRQRTGTHKSSAPSPKPDAQPSGDLAAEAGSQATDRAADPVDESKPGDVAGPLADSLPASQEPAADTYQPPPHQDWPGVPVAPQVAERPVLPVAPAPPPTTVAPEVAHPPGATEPGSVDPAAFDKIRAEIKSRLPYFQACADAARRRGGPDVRRLQATWLIAADGAIRELKVEGVPDPQLVNCITRMGSRPFPVGPGAELIIPTPIVFVR